MFNMSAKFKSVFFSRHFRRSFKVGVVIFGGEDILE